ncbi:MAG: TIGR02444 family protein [Pseudolabrys sp.]
MNSPFWDFSIAVYGASRVERECLALQDQFGLDINLVLLCAFLGRDGIALTPDDIASVRQEVQSWQQNVVSALRAVRRRLKTVTTTNADAANAAADLRANVKVAELESERIEQTMLEQWATARLATRPRGDPRDMVPANLQALLAGYGIGADRPADAALRHLIAAALAR